MIIWTAKGWKRMTGPVATPVENPRLARLEVNFLISRNRSIVEYNDGVTHSPKRFPLHGLALVPLYTVPDKLVACSRRMAKDDTVITA